MSYFPDPSGLATELLFGSTWTDVTRYALGRDAVAIGRGQSAEGSNVDPSRCELSLRNGDGRFNSRNPTGPYYGQLVRNTQLRVRVLRPVSRLVLPENIASGSAYVDTPDSVGLSITGDLDVRIDMRLDSWSAYLQWVLIHKGMNTASQQSWGIFTSTNTIVGQHGAGRLVLTWSTNGTNAGQISAESTVPVVLVGRQVIRATLDVNNGAGGWTVTWYTGDTVDGPWTQLGDPVVGAGTTSIFDSTSTVRVRPQMRAEVYALKILSGIGGTEKANPDFTNQPDGARTVLDAAGNTWTVQDDAQISRWYHRFSGEVGKWPQRFEQGGLDAWAPIQAAGILRRLGVGTTPLKSALYRGLTASTALVAYWPCEDGSSATQLASGLGDSPMLITGGTPQLASTAVADGSGLLPTLGNSRWTGTVPTYTGTGAVELRFIAQIPAAGMTNGAVLARLDMTGTAVRWELVYTTGGTGNLALKSYNTAGTLLQDSGPVDVHINGTNTIILLRLQQSGPNVNWEFYGAAIGGAIWGPTGTLTSNTISRATRVQIDVSSNIDQVAVGHISVQSAVTAGIVSEQLSNQVIGWTHEPAAARIRRLCEEEGVPVRILGWYNASAATSGSLSWIPDPTTPMGPQRPATLLDLLRECADTDMGLLFEPRDQLCVGYRPRASLYNQRPALTLAYNSRGLADLQPTEDDRLLANDVTVTRLGGSSARAVLETGTLSVQDPPAGAGRYDVDVDINTDADTTLPDQAGWRLHLATVDEARYPAIDLNLTTLLQADTAAAVDPGDRVVIVDPPAGQPPDDISQLVIGMQERLDASVWDLELVGTPESPWRVAVYNSTDSRYSSDGSTLATGVNATATSLSVATPSGPLWTHADGDFDIRIAGERLTVTNVTGSSSPQTFTVRRSVNGVVKSLPAATAVELWQPAIYAL